MQVVLCYGPQYLQIQWVRLPGPCQIVDQINIEDGTETRAETRNMGQSLAVQYPWDGYGVAQQVDGIMLRK